MLRPLEREVLKRAREGKLDRGRVVEIFEHLVEKNSIPPGESEEHGVFRSFLERFGEDKHETLRAATFLNILYSWARGELADEVVEEEYRRRLNELKKTLRVMKIVQESRRILEALHVADITELATQGGKKRLEELVGKLSKHPEVKKHIHG